MQSSLDRFLRKRQAPAESNCGEEEQCQEKEPKTTEATEDLSSRKRYEEKRKQEGRTFRQEWKKTFAWLQFDETKQEMFCTACREFSSLADKNSSFFTGSQAFHIGNIKAHASNRKHKACVLAKQQREQQERGSRNVVQCLRHMSSDTEEKMKKLFNISYFIAKHERPFSDFEDFCKLHVKNGLSLGETYINDKGCRVFVEAIDGVMKEDESQQVNNQRFISVMADSGTDTSNKDLELVYVRFLLQMLMQSTSIRPALERNDFDFATVAGEWSALKACVTVNNFRHLDPLILWQRMFTAFKDQFPGNILMLVEIILILPLATATVERGFSAMKNDWRSCLETDILNMLLRITINGCSFDVFDPQRAIQHWWTSGQRARRPDFQRNT